MANITPTITPLGNPSTNQGDATLGYVGVGNQNMGAILVVWGPMANGDIGLAVDFCALPDRSFQVEGTFGVGGTCVLQGSNNSSNYQTLSDPQGVALSRTAAGLKQVLEVPRLVRPNITGGDGTTSLTVSMVFRGPRRA